MTDLRPLFRTEPPAALRGGHAPAHWQCLLQRHDARLKTLGRAAGWVDSLSAVNLKLLDSYLWGDLLPQLVSQSAQEAVETGTGSQSRATSERRGQTRAAAHPGPPAHRPETSTAREIADALAAEAGVLSPARTRPRPSTHQRRSRGATARTLPTPGSRDSFTAAGRAFRAVERSAHSVERSASGVRAAPAYLSTPEGGDSPHPSLDIGELPREAGRELLVKFQRPGLPSTTVTLARPANGHAPRANLEAPTEVARHKYFFLGRESVDAAQPRSPAHNDARPGGRPRAVESHSLAPRQREVRDVSAQGRAGGQTQSLANNAGAETTRWARHESHPGRRAKPHSQDVSTDASRETWRGEMAGRVSRVMIGDGPASVASVLTALCEQFAATLDGPSAPSDLLTTLAGPAIHHGELSGENSPRRATAAGTAARDAGTLKGSTPEREMSRLPAPASVKTVAQAVGQSAHRTDVETTSADLSSAVAGRDASLPPNIFEQHATTFAAPVLPPLLTPQTAEAQELAVAVAVAREGVRSESLAAAEDLDLLAEKIKLILDEQARRHGIDV